MSIAFSCSGLTSILPSIRQMICFASVDLPHKSVPRMPAVTWRTVMRTSRCTQAGICTPSMTAAGSATASPAAGTSAAPSSSAKL